MNDSSRNRFWSNLLKMLREKIATIYSFSFGQKKKTVLWNLLFGDEKSSIKISILFPFLSVFFPLSPSKNR